jgi:hypothetical protein
MRRLIPWAALLFLALPVFADEPTYTIKIKSYPDKDQLVSCREVDKQMGMIRFIGPDGKVLKEEPQNEESEEFFTLIVLEPGERAPVHYRETFEKAMASKSREQKRSYEGTTVDFVLKEGKYKLKLPDKSEVTEKDQEALLSRANGDLEAGLDQIFQPEKPVKMGETWPVPFALLNKGFGALGKLDQERTRGTAKLMKVYDRVGKQYGLIEIHLALFYLNLDNLTFEPPALFQIDGALDTAIDGSTNIGVVSIVTRLMGRTQIEQGGLKVTLEVVREGKGLKERFAVKK